MSIGLCPPSAIHKREGGQDAGPVSKTHWDKWIQENYDFQEVNVYVFN
jgi:hypothetical protein